MTSGRPGAARIGAATSRPIMLNQHRGLRLPSIHPAGPPDRRLSALDRVRNISTHNILYNLDNNNKEFTTTLNIFFADNRVKMAVRFEGRIDPASRPGSSGETPIASCAMLRSRRSDDGMD
jgi:hypothetical protein